MPNSLEVLSTFLPEAVAQRGEKLAFEKEEFARVLGVICSPENDVLTFTADFPGVHSLFIRRE